MTTDIPFDTSAEVASQLRSGVANPVIKVLSIKTRLPQCPFQLSITRTRLLLRSNRLQPPWIKEWMDHKRLDATTPVEQDCGWNPQ